MTSPFKDAGVSDYLFEFKDLTTLLLKAASFMAFLSGSTGFNNLSICVCN